ncbi:MULTISPECIES: PASTA domain-containing protein [Aestuariibaculum]|uniref:PASTA domain-containing protein n=1 Tax=Aestuariibaculum lutulentum TaxID=2920935 RepID=A0ABS9REU9_9FLAO|nr:MULTISPECIES: PASTA domain-containing protein [Aestuariibaculum]MCH4551469.1 PASTA domain-containing protein [Aestuariibaculum lutulentum]MCR8666567.1 PASTA domain-containing protein [Aestuariibaculum sp. M13]
MSLIKFLTSKAFFKQILIAVIAVFVLVYIILKWLNVTTNHGEFETVPELKGKSISIAEMELNDNHLVMQIQDSANYNPDYPKFSVIEQEPPAGSKVKENRKIYITLNPSGYRKIAVPDLNERTFRQAKPTLEALGFKVGKLTYVDNIAKDVVLKMQHKGEVLNPGDQLPKTSTIDLVLGNGNRP